jgi:hypothetical protein
MWKQLVLAILKQCGLIALETGSAVAKEKLTPHDPRIDTGKIKKP